ncbi:fatty-acyl-CoA synthase/long-chain acyl-CoA synthetase [Lachnotalea glycerini]|nr:class I adenylate-forming enzyme family protein [Lachnotalea glycerini]PXV91624.1 fatty-acyl-CoA synthase/long-chain acyl-CoA synthetase [Lachnotalea glycerini]
MNNEDYILNGNDYWPASILDGLTSHRFMDQDFDFYPDVPTNLYDALCHNAFVLPDSVCIVDDSGKTYTFIEFLKLVDNFSNMLFYNYHVGPSSHIALLLYNGIEFCVSFLAIIKLGGIMIPLPTKYKKEEILSLIRKSNLTGIILDQSFQTWFEPSFDSLPYFTICVNGDYENCGLPLSEENYFTTAVSCTARAADTAIIMFTSGTTSRSKGVMITNYNIMHAVAVYQKIFHITSNDTSIIPVPIYHVTGLIGLFGLFIYTGGCIHLHKLFNAKRVLYEIEKYQISFLHGSPTVFSLLLELADSYTSLPSLRILACGSSNMPKQKILQLHNWLPNAQFRTVYGLTETSSPASIFPDDAALSNFICSSGHPIPGVMFKICDESGNSLPPQRIGSIFVKGTVVLAGYYHQETELFQNDWLDTGDLGYFNPEGYLYIVDRKKDMINRGGEKICSFDVENALYNLEGVREAAVVGILDAIYGEVPAAMVVPEQGFLMTEESIKKQLSSQLAKFQIPTKVIVAKALPLTPNSKINKRAIKRIITQNLNKNSVK